ncbi:MAG: GTPase Era [Deltaproteobacteria bacterium]|nr:GTPase Era [Deltaproteobacteria bacterium]|tara:strand:- start:413 stop:1327 length:915 start_codon:yes stop_codon:yes gene_type:complete
MTTSGHRSGYVAIVGRPNVGKSTLLNHILGTKLSIVSFRPQTTRNRILGIYNQEDAQVVFMDTPGIHEADSLLNKRMVDQATRTLSDVDVVVHLIDPRTESDPTEARIEAISEAKVPVLLVPNKVDLVKKSSLLPLIEGWTRAEAPAAIVPISALSGDGVAGLLDEVVQRLPESPPFFPKDQLTDASERFVVSEMIRERLFVHLHQELPYSIAVEIEAFEEPKQKSGVIRILARIWVERDSQKGIVIGKGGRVLKQVGTEAREAIERLLQARVHLKITVGVDKHWTRKQSSVERRGHFDGDQRQ